MNYHNITTDDMKNGDGLRVVLWVSGCVHQCKGCHNQITWDSESGLPFDKNAELEIINKLEPDYISGITLSGGDPLYPSNQEEITRLTSIIRERFPHKTIWLYTGYLWEDIRHLPLIKHTDVVVDGKFVNSLADAKLHWCGSSNQRVIDVAKSLSTGIIHMMK